jgi:hypothetical protein
MKKTMKKYKKMMYMILSTVLCTLCLAGMFSCEDFLEEDPKGQLATQVLFTSPGDLDLALNALYKVVSDAGSANNNIGTDMAGGDDISTHPAANKVNVREHDQYSISDNNAWLPTLWANRWTTVKAANFVINNVGRTPDVSEAEIRSAIAQAHYWRAFAYFYLVQCWGRVPIMLEEEVNYDAQPSSVEEIYNLVVEDLKIAEAGVPVNYTSAPYAQNGKNIAVSQGAVKATMAYVYLSMAGWPLNKGTEYYQLAAAKAKEVIDGAENGTYYYTLLDEYWKIHSVEYNYNNPEVLVAAYYYNNGSWATTYNWSPIADVLANMAQGGWGDTNGEIKFWYNFPEGPRKEATYSPKILLGNGELVDWWYDTPPPSNRDVVAPVFIKYAENATPGKEYDYTDPTPIGMIGGKSHHVVRLSQVYCWYAEAVGRSGQTNSQAIELLNRVRNRADGRVSNIYPAGMSPQELAEAAYNEHGWEIGGEYWNGFATRYHDMFRMNRVKDHFEFRKLNPGIEVAPGIFRRENVPVTGTWDDSKMYAPYPYGDKILNPNLN